MLPVVLGVPHGVFLGALLFFLHLNDVENTKEYSSIYLFDDVSKVSREMSSYRDYKPLQADVFLYRL